MRATFMPCSASGMAQPRMTSSTVSAFTAGTRESAPLMASAAMWSGRVRARAPLPAFPTAVRTDETITGSGMDHHLVPEGLALFEHVLDAVPGLLRAQQGEEGFPLQVEEMLLAGHPWLAVAPAEDGRHPGGHHAIVLADVAAAQRVVDAHLEDG